MSVEVADAIKSDESVAGVGNPRPGGDGVVLRVCLGMALDTKPSGLMAVLVAVMGAGMVILAVASILGLVYIFRK